jgi:hypothetical protein
MAKWVQEIVSTFTPLYFAKPGPHLSVCLQPLLKYSLIVRRAGHYQPTMKGHPMNMLPSTGMNRSTCLLAVLAFCLAAPQMPSQEQRNNRDAGPPRQERDRPPRDERGRRGGEGRRCGPQQYSLEQAVSQEAQLHTIAFSGLAFITGDFGASTFMPPGKVCDFFGFQYMRDIDVAQKGHNPMFLDRVAGNVLRLLNDEQRALFEKAARQEALALRKLADQRLPVIYAFHRELRKRAIIT